MSRRTLPKSIRATAAASVVACTAGMVSQSAEADVLPVWIDAPSAEGVFVPDSSPFDSLSYIDLDQDDTDDFWFYYYGFFRLNARSGNGSMTFNPNGDILYDSVSISSNPIFVSVAATVFTSRDEVYTAALGYTPLSSEVVSVITTPPLEDLFGSRAILGGTFQGGDGNTYAAYFDLEVVVDAVLANNSLTIYDAGYALIPEPSSLALLGLGGLLLARRRRS